MFESIILAGGFGTRLREVSGNIPKPMVEVGDEPFLYKLMKKLESDGCSKIILSLHYQSDYFISRINKDKPVDCKVCFCIEDIPLGTGGALKLASKYVSSEKFIALNGDTYQDINYKDFYDESSSANLYISAVKTDNCDRYGVLQFDNQLNVLSMSTKGTDKGGYINSGTYVVNKKEISEYKSDIFSFEKDFIEKFTGTFKAYVHDNFFIDIGIPKDYQRACKLLS